jgi:N-acetylglucosamine-6-phosphate deacetylase
MLSHVVHDMGWPIPEAVTMASTVPASVMGMADRKGAIERGYDADIALFTDDFTCAGTLVQGRWVHRAQ